MMQRRIDIGDLLTSIGYCVLMFGLSLVFVAIAYAIFTSTIK